MSPNQSSLIKSNIEQGSFNKIIRKMKRNKLKFNPKIQILTILKNKMKLS